MVDIIHGPPWEMIEFAHHDLKHGRKEWPERFSDRWYWTRWWSCGHTSNKFTEPFLIMDGQFMEAMIAFTDHRPEHKTLEVHFCAAGNPMNPVGLYRAVDRILTKMLSDLEVNILYGHINTRNKIGIKTAKAFGFKEIAIVDDIWYSAKTLNRGQ